MDLEKLAKEKAETILNTKGVEITCPSCKNKFVGKSNPVECPNCHKTFDVEFKIN